MNVVEALLGVDCIRKKHACLPLGSPWGSLGFLILLFKTYNLYRFKTKNLSGHVAGANHFQHFPLVFRHRCRAPRPSNPPQPNRKRVVCRNSAMRVKRQSLLPLREGTHFCNSSRCHMSRRRRLPPFAVGGDRGAGAMSRIQARNPIAAQCACSAMQRRYAFN